MAAVNGYREADQRGSVKTLPYGTDTKVPAGTPGGKSPTVAAPTNRGEADQGTCTPVPMPK